MIHVSLICHNNMITVQNLQFLHIIYNVIKKKTPFIIKLIILIDKVIF